MRTGSLFALTLVWVSCIGQIGCRSPGGGPADAGEPFPALAGARAEEARVEESVPAQALPEEAVAKEALPDGAAPAAEPAAAAESAHEESMNSIFRELKGLQAEAEAKEARKDVPAASPASLVDDSAPDLERARQLLAQAVARDEPEDGATPAVATHGSASPPGPPSAPAGSVPASPPSPPASPPASAAAVPQPSPSQPPASPPAASPPAAPPPAAAAPQPPPQPPAQPSAAQPAPAQPAPAQPAPAPAPPAPAPPASAPPASAPPASAPPASAPPASAAAVPQPSPSQPPASPPAASPPAAAAPPPPAPPPASPPAPGAQQPPAQQPKGFITVKEMYHKTSDELIRFLKEAIPEWIEKKHVAKIEGKGRSVMVFGETPAENDPLTKKISAVIDGFDDLELKLESRILRPHYVDPRVVMDALAMRGLANIWQMTEETLTTTQVVSPTVTNQQVQKHSAYTRSGLVTTASEPLPAPPKIPYVYELPATDPYTVPREYNGEHAFKHVLVDFKNMTSTEERGGVVAVGTVEDIERIQAFIDSIDVPARRIMIEVQVIELDANKFLDFGFDSVQFGQRHTLGNVALPLPGESIIQPGFGETVRRNPDAFVPPITQEGFQTIFDDSSVDLSGRFLTTLHALVREGDAKVKARPKILTLDDRVSVLHIGREVPTFVSTGVTRDATNGNLVSEVSQVTTQYVGFTLNLRPRVTGGEEDEVSLQVEVIVNELGERQRVFEQDLLGIPTIIRRQFIGQNRVKNHRPIILGGLIQEQEVESANKIPLLGDIPLLGYLFRRTQNSRSRTEIILVLTPHILSESGVDRVATPKESPHFDTFDSVLFNDRHIIKGRDVLGIDPITGNPTQADGKIFTEDEIIDLTLLNIIKQRQLVSKLRILEDYLGDEAGAKLSWIQRKWPERTVRNWDPKEQQPIFFRAAAIVLENIKELNPDLTYEELVAPRREIILPTTPYRISLSFDRVQSLQALAAPMILRGERVELTEKTVAILREVSGRGLRDFADFLEARKRQAEDHGELLAELKRLYSGQYPDRNNLEGVPYPKVYEEMAKAKFDFVAIATYFQENLADRYKVVGPPNVGSFEADLTSFAQTSLSLYQRAKQLQELEAKWGKLMQAPPEEGDG